MLKRSVSWYRITAILGVCCVSACSKQDIPENRGFVFPEGKEKALLLSYDDGLQQDRKLVSLFNRHGVVGTFNLNSGLLGTKSTFREKAEFHVSESEVRELYANHEVASHGLLHTDLTILKPEQIEIEVLTDKANLEKILGKEILTHALPYGRGNTNIHDALRNMNFLHIRTIQDSHSLAFTGPIERLAPTTHDSQLDQHIQAFLNADSGLKVLYVWGHSWEFDDREKGWEIFEAQLSQLAGREDVWYVSVGEFVQYINAVENIKFKKVSFGDKDKVRRAEQIINPIDNHKAVWLKIQNGYKKIAPGEIFER